MIGVDRCAVEYRAGGHAEARTRVQRVGTGKINLTQAFPEYVEYAKRVPRIIPRLSLALSATAKG